MSTAELKFHAHDGSVLASQSGAIEVNVAETAEAGVIKVTQDVRCRDLFSSFAHLWRTTRRKVSASAIT